MSHPLQEEGIVPFSRFLLPGHGLPLNFAPREAFSRHEKIDSPEEYGLVEYPAIVGEGGLPFVTALDCNDVEGGIIALPLTTLREFTMLQFMNLLSDKYNWDKKVFDEAIVSKWRTEALATRETDVTERMFDYCIAELRYKAKIFQDTGTFIVYNGDVVKSDTAVPSSLRKALTAAVSPLEDVTARRLDWHPGSDEKVLDLVHPSLFPLIYGRSRILPDSLTTLQDCIERCGEGKVIPVPPKEEARLDKRWNPFHAPAYPYSRKFQWLPCEVDISSGKTKITSYVNNLHPQKNSVLYGVIEQIIACAIPLWNITLTGLKGIHHHRSRIYYTACREDPSEGHDFPDDEGPQRATDEDEGEYLSRRYAWMESNAHCVVVQPEPGEFRPPAPFPETVDLRKDFGKRGLQVIVKLANIHLTPDKPEYEGGTWHVEGQLNEHICATALYYYDCVNVTRSELAFRQNSEVSADSIDYRQDHHQWLEDVYGCQNNGPAVQIVGSVVTQQGRLLTFPNILQHRVEPFGLADPTRPGHRKILALFLVDPHIRVTSTANVPCQQRDWWGEHLVSGEARALPRLPVELQYRVFEQVEGFPLGLEEAKGLRLELMEERKHFVMSHGETFVGNSFSLCEH